MRLAGPSSLRLRLVVALVAVAAVAVGLATVLSHQGIHPRLERAAQARVERSADEVAREAQLLYGGDGWSVSDLHDLEHFALANQLALTVVDANGATLLAGDAGGVAPLERETAPSFARRVHVDGQKVGTLVLAPLGTTVFTPEETALEASLNRLHLLAGLAATAVAVAAALIFAETLSRPLRRIREAALRIARGDLSTRVEPRGGAELAAVGEALNRLAASFEQEEEARREGVAALAHELRTPVSGLLSRIEAAQDRVLADERANLDAMHAEALRLTRLLDDLSRLAEAEQPELLLERRTTDLADVARTSADALASAFVAKEIELSLDLEPAFVLGDVVRLGQIATNLLTNALRYTETGGIVEVRTRSQGERSLLEVRDTGIGIDSAHRERIFDRFWRADRSRSRATGGTGIGLTIVRELVRAHGGAIAVASSPGIGSRFSVSFRAVPAPPSRSEPARARAAG